MASYPVSVRRVHDFVIGFLRIPPRDGHPCLDGWFRSSRSMGDFHPLNASHTEHTRRKRLRYTASAMPSICADVVLPSRQQHRTTTAIQTRGPERYSIDLNPHRLPVELHDRPAVAGVIERDPLPLNTGPAQG